MVYCLLKLFILGCDGAYPLFRFHFAFISQKRRVENENFEFSNFESFTGAWIRRFQGRSRSDSAEKV